MTLPLSALARSLSPLNSAFEGSLALSGDRFMGLRRQEVTCDRSATPTDEEF